MAATKLIFFLACTVVCAIGCRRTSNRAPAATSASALERPVAAPLAGERVDIPAGAFRVGSRPGEAGRRPEIEQRSDTVELGPFRIDRLPYPNDPAEPPLVNIAREEAQQKCEQRGTRLCTELEWERACRGPDSRLFSIGNAWQERCTKEPRSCASGFDVLAMGSLREWTASDVVPAEDAPRKAAVRGAAPGAPDFARRCAARTAEKADTRSDSIGFRCCKGPPNAALVNEPRAGTTFVRATLTPSRLAELLRADPKTKALGNDVRFFRDPDAAETVVARGPGDRKGFFFTVAPLLWNPVAGAEFLVAVGRSGEKTSFVVVFHVLGKDEYSLASSFVMEDETGPVALAYNGYIRPRLHFSTCWGCPGETGKILYRDPDAVAVGQP